jgi:hypothetical protein
LKKAWQSINCIKVPDKKDNGTITKFVTVAILSNFSDHNPAIIPTLPKIKDDKKVKEIKVK